ncbi:MAG: PLP-dependent aspartate aminotransferase family protein [Euryarchaeota archaeon]|nr:PLP-dependent aspartate aminotransferase family protein [Euryarchaeota archaeon]MBU4547318.1 PLP-dependent aspartate aminotransferase family protein [Euryarchaeota archaeon]MBU4608770.1 PLP-dependent aspartate aminotransferase family protein [Euryarchaeota archaeon]MBV1755987.1 PLP-dependent aspartate aminotransferase family protein [Methanobacterium sp.]MBV1767535.1 PLP-dependent aspartate aminotransferase family protein [Methanobacterium sp.]
MKFKTKSVHAGRKPDPVTGAISTPIYQTSTFVFDDYKKPKEHDYSRTSNPTRSSLESALAILEGGHNGFAFSSGMSAISTTLHLLKAGDHVVSCDDIYGGTYRLFAEILPKFGIEFTFLRLDDEDALQDAIKPNTRMIWGETPSNPLLNITDLEMISRVAQESNQDILTVADNTFATPYFLKPIEWGIDLVIHSTTKYLNGHSDVIGGTVITTSPKLSEDIHFLLNGLGTNAAPFDSWLILRGLKTLPLRMKQHAAGAQAVAEFLDDHSRTEEVFYPGLPSHPGHDIAQRQMKGFGGVVSFNLKNEVKPFLNKLEIFSLAESLGGADSLVEHAATMSHASMTPLARKKAGITDKLIRLSIGLEDEDDLIEDLSLALG